MRRIALKSHLEMKVEVASMDQPVFSIRSEAVNKDAHCFFNANLCFLGPGLGFTSSCGCRYTIEIKGGNHSLLSSLVWAESELLICMQECLYPRDWSANTKWHWHPSPPPAASSASHLLCCLMARRVLEMLLSLTFCSWCWAVLIGHSKEPLGSAPSCCCSSGL